MFLSAKQAENEIFDLLRQWCDAMIGLQLDMPGKPEFDGGILCPVCGLLHGRSGDAIYPLMCMADRTGDEKYMRAAKKLFAWSGNMLCDDGSMYNDSQSAWNGITVFGAVSLCDALTRHGHLLDSKTRTAWEDRLSANADWLYRNLRPGMPTNVNYFACNSAAMALLGKYFGRREYLALAKTLADLCMELITENGLLSGEGKPMNGRTAKNCAPIDAGGYNVEESLPSLTRYALCSGDTHVLQAVTASWRAHLDFMLPDGAWDNSFGTRNFKWTYWGSRTSDGCQEALFALGKTDPVFAEAAYRNFELFRRCSPDGLLRGGPDYAAHGERPCVHHTFCHSKVLAGVLDEGLYGFERCALPSDTASGVRYYPETDSLRIAKGDWRADITAYDFEYLPGGHTSGGSLSLLWSKAYGPVVAAGMTDYSLHEPHNQQLSRKKAEHLCTSPRIVLTHDGILYGTHYDFGADLTYEENADAVRAAARCRLCSKDHAPLSEDAQCSLEYTLTGDGITVSGRVGPAIAGAVSYILPLAGPSARPDVTVGTLTGKRPFFNLEPGLMGTEYTVRPDADGRFALTVCLS